MKLVADMSLCGRPWRPRRGITPAALVLDFAAGRYAPGAFPDLVSFTRASTATYIDSTGTMQTAAIDEPRFDHDPVTHEALGLLVEESRTNLIPHSEDFTDASWGVGSSGTGANPILTSNAGVAPDGTTTADQIIFDKGVGAAGDSYSVIGSNLASTPGGAVEKSVWLSTISGTAQVALKSLTSTSEYMVCNVTTEWQRFTLNTVPASGSDGLQLILRGTYGTSDSATLLVWGAQLEVGSTPSSYIPTNGSTVTRAADSVTIPAAKLPYSAVAMSIAMEGRMSYADNSLSFSTVVLSEWQKDTGNELTARISTYGSATGYLQVFNRVGGTAYATASSDNYFSPGVDISFSIAGRFTANAVNGAVDGAAFTENTSATALPDLTSVDLKLAPTFMGTIKSFRMWATDIGDTGIEEATS
ncbi:phage head spike fiber domain-containing protein [Antarcticimicrobium sediminis]|uniref:Uncharacterized protein n=1 Tax=Antarcticimicrobium sediminis TaxID=2546227 RepID=A0A4R5ETC1_9RHOB|nr:hypothetical protein [Antarcticimicrobium sediminis]TDE37972.1 hypothetical protein E1B25_11145 [Antarcticimicrobium sediminis]